MKYQKQLLAASLLITLTACGGGSGDLVHAPVQTETAEPSETGAALALPATDSETDTTASGSTGSGSGLETSQLLTTKSFDFSTQWQMAIDFDIADAKAKDGFLSICSEFEFDGESAYDVNYNKCAVRTAISNGLYNSQINVTNDVDALLAVVWFQDELDPPLYYEFSVTNAQESIVWR